MNWRYFDGISLLLHILAIVFVVAFIYGLDYCFGRVPRTGRQVLIGDVMFAVAGTTIIYAFLFDSSLLPEFDTKGALAILFGGWAVTTFIKSWKAQR